MTINLNSHATVCQIKKGKTPNWNQVSRENMTVETLWRQYDRLKITNGILYREWIDATGIKKNRDCGECTLNMYTFFIYLTKVNIK